MRHWTFKKTLCVSTIAISLIIGVLIFLRCKGYKFANELTFIGTMTLAAVTIYQNRALREQNEELRKDARLNVNRPYLDIVNIFLVDYNDGGPDAWGSTPIYFKFENGVWSGEFTASLPQNLVVQFRNAGNSENDHFIELEYEPHSCSVGKDVNHKLERDNISFDMYQLRDLKVYCFLLHYKNPTNCIFWQEFRIEVNPCIKEEDMTDEQKEEPRKYKVEVTIGTQQYKLI